MRGEAPRQPESDWPGQYGSSLNQSIIFVSCKIPFKKYPAGNPAFFLAPYFENGNGLLLC
jgi:hypothetical protein